MSSANRLDSRSSSPVLKNSATANGVATASEAITRAVRSVLREMEVFNGTPTD